jgi:hypothetical protein
MTDAGFNGHGETVVFQHGSAGINKDGSFDIVVRVKVPMDNKKLTPGEKVPVQVTVYPGNGAPVHVQYGHDKLTDMTVKVHGAK